MIECVILAGGLGTRLRSVVSHVPKPLAPINGVAFLDLLLTQIAGFSAVSKVVLAIGYKASQIVQHYKYHTFPFLLEFSIEDFPLGTGGALKKALNLIESEHVLVLNGDSYLSFSFSELWNFHLQTSADITLSAVFAKSANRYGLLELDIETTQILSFKEKSQESTQGLVNAGVYLMKKTIMDEFIFDGAFSLEKDVFPKCISHKMYAHICTGPFIDIGTPESFLLAQQMMRTSWKR